jgi:FkbH-like protein
MVSTPSLYWLLPDANFRSKLKQISSAGAEAWQAVIALANTRLDFTGTNALDAVIRKLFGAESPQGLATKEVRLAILSSSTTTHLLPAIRVAAARRGVYLTTYENDYGQYLAELANKHSALHSFGPTAVLFTFDAQHIVRRVHATQTRTEVDGGISEVLTEMKQCWQLARDSFACPIIQQTVLNVFPSLMGGNEHRLAGSKRAVVSKINSLLPVMADECGVDLLDLNDRASIDGLLAWHDPALWHRSKQEVTPTASPMYGELVVRILAAKQGLSRKCLVLDLDNTLWGGVIGDDGLNGIVIGQGSALGEGFVALQQYAKELAKRGVILAVCSKNDESNALEPFTKHPDMVLRRADFASFHANWTDKASNIRAIAKEISIGLDSIVFLDDNPFERTLVRQELPMVAVPEVSDEPDQMLTALSDAGYFEALTVTTEDRDRQKQYELNAEREAMKSSSTDMESYLSSLAMQLICSEFDELSLQRIVQLINKTNQFNLTTKRYTTDDVMAVIDSPTAFGLHLRLLDRFGDNGIIAVIIGKVAEDRRMWIDTWLMSCRVLGRKVEESTLEVIVREAKRRGATSLVGEFRPTAKNGMVASHYSNLGFIEIPNTGEGIQLFELDLSNYRTLETKIEIKEVTHV